MGLSTHVLDTMHGCPAAGMAVELYTTEGADATLVKRFTLNGDGRNPDGPLYDNSSLKKGTYRLVFDVAGYFRARGVALPEPSFLDKVSAGLRRGATRAALPRAVAGEPVELFHLPGLMRRNQSWPSVSVSSWNRPLLCHSQVSV